MGLAKDCNLERSSSWESFPENLKLSRFKTQADIFEALALSILAPKSRCQEGLRPFIET